MTPAIPRIIHQIWVGPDPLDEHLLSYHETWRRHHPGWEVRLWTEENLPPDLRRPEAQEKLRLPAERADILRLDLLWRHGGVYLDIDCECLRSIEPLLDGVDFFATYLKPGRVANAVIGAVPRHGIIDRALNEIRPSEYGGLNKSGTGTLFFTDVLSHFPEAKILEPSLFYPASPAEREGAFAVHHAERSWRSEEGREAVLRLENRLQLTLERLENSERQAREWREKVEEARLALERNSVCGRLGALRSTLRRGLTRSRAGTQP